MSRYAIVTCEFTFEASHSLPWSGSQCQRPHGHTYRLQISLRGPITEERGKPDDGMVVDIEDLKHNVNMMIFTGVSCDKTTCGGMNQNDLNTLTDMSTTAPNLVHWIWDALVAAGVPDHLLYRIRLHETETDCAEIMHTEREIDETAYEGFK